MGKISSTPLQSVQKNTCHWVDGNTCTLQPHHKFIIKNMDLCREKDQKCVI